MVESQILYFSISESTIRQHIINMRWSYNRFVNVYDKDVIKEFAEFLSNEICLFKLKDEQVLLSYEDKIIILAEKAFMFAETYQKITYTRGIIAEYGNYLLSQFNNLYPPLYNCDNNIDNKIYLCDCNH